MVRPGTGQISPCEDDGARWPSSIACWSLCTITRAAGLGSEATAAARTTRPLLARLGTVTSTLRRPTPSGETRTSSRVPAPPVKITERTAERLRPRTFRRAESRTLIDRLPVEAALPAQRDRHEIPVITGRWANWVPPYAPEPPALLAPPESPPFAELGEESPPESPPFAAAGTAGASAQARVRANAAASVRLFRLPLPARFTCGLPFAQAYGVS